MIPTSKDLKKIDNQAIKDTNGKLFIIYPDLYTAIWTGGFFKLFLVASIYKWHLLGITISFILLVSFYIFMFWLGKIAWVCKDFFIVYNIFSFKKIEYEAIENIHYNLISHFASREIVVFYKETEVTHKIQFGRPKNSDNRKYLEDFLKEKGLNLE